MLVVRDAAKRASSLSPMVLVLIGLGAAGRAADINQLGQTLVFDFEDYTAAGVKPGGGDGTLDSDSWQLSVSDNGPAGTEFTFYGDTFGPGVFGLGASVGSVTERGFYAFDTGGGNTALGMQLGNEGFASASATLRLNNATGFTIDILTVEYDVWVLNDSDGMSFVDLEFSQQSGFIDPILYDTPFDADSPAVWVKESFVYDLFLPIQGFSGNLFPLEDGETIDVRWTAGGLFDTLNAFDELAVDGIRITAFSSEVPEPASWVLLAAALVAARRR